MPLRDSKCAAPFVKWRETPASQEHPTRDRRATRSRPQRQLVVVADAAAWRIVDLLRQSFGVRVISEGRNMRVPDHERLRGGSARRPQKLTRPHLPVSEVRCILYLAGRQGQLLGHDHILILLREQHAGPLDARGELDRARQREFSPVLKARRRPRSFYVKTRPRRILPNGPHQMKSPRTRIDF